MYLHTQPDRPQALRAVTGITIKELKRLADLLKPLQTPKMPLAEPPPRDVVSGRRCSFLACIGCGRKSSSR
jgi:hypothetical protein